MQEVTIDDYKLMDKILSDLNVKQKSTMEFENDFPGREDDIEACLQELLSTEYIEMPYADGGGTYKITIVGKKFIASNSFEQVAEKQEADIKRKAEQEERNENRKELEFNWKEKDELRKNLTICFAVITLAMAGWNIYIQVSNSRNLQKSTLLTDSLKNATIISKQRLDSLIQTTKEISKSKAIYPTQLKTENIVPIGNSKTSSNNK